MASFCGYVLGTSIEISFFLSAFLVVLLIGYNLIIKICSKITKKDIKFSKYNLDKRFYIPSLFLFIAIFLFASNEGFKQVASDRGMANISISQDILVEFWNLYINSCFSSLTIYWMIFTLLMITSFFFAIKKNEIKKVIFPLLLQVSILAIMFSLVLCGKTYDEMTRDRFYLHHANIIFLYKMLILYPILIYFSYVLKNIRKYIKKVFPILILITLIYYGIFTYVKFPSFKQKSIAYYKEFNELRRNFYISEKMLRFYALKNETAILDKDIITNYCHTWILCGEENNYKDTKIISSYYPRIYRQDIKELGFKLEENAVEKFKKNGGSITEDELNNLNFSRLFDENYVLNKDN